VPREADYYLCGPALFLHDLKAGLSAWGVNADRVHAEVFGPGESLTPGIVAAASQQPHQPTGEQGTGARVSFARSGIDVNWDPKYQSVLELAEACDVPVKWSCRTGVCHTCESALISGAVNYQPEPLQAPAEGKVLICCSQPRGDIAIDL
jgi:ferredoxin